MSGTPKKILVVDDEAKITDVLKSYLENSGYIVFTAHTGRCALELYESGQPDLVILDLMLPDISGEEILRALRKKSDIPVMMLTAKVEEKDILENLGSGADDYVTKPFSPRQVVARTAAVLRRTGGRTELNSAIASFDEGRFVIDTDRHEIKKDGEAIPLTPSEYDITAALASRPGKVFTREELINSALRDDFNGYDRVIDTYIKNIRQKVEDDPKNPKYILTVHGVGYRFGGVLS